MVKHMQSEITILMVFEKKKNYGVSMYFLSFVSHNFLQLNKMVNSVHTNTINHEYFYQLKNLNSKSNFFLLSLFLVVEM